MSKLSMKLIKIDLKHYPEILAVHLLSFAKELEQLGIENDKNIQKISHEFGVRWKVGIKKGTVKGYYATIKDNIVGFIADLDGEVAVYVHPDYMRKGIGSNLLQKMRPKNVWILEGNEVAQKFYNKNNYRKTKVQTVIKFFGGRINKVMYEAYKPRAKSRNK